MAAHFFAVTGCSMPIRGDVWSTSCLGLGAVSNESVTVDGNHPMAGKTLCFEVTVASVREATPEELEVAAGHETGCGCGGSGDSPSN